MNLNTLKNIVQSRSSVNPIGIYPQGERRIQFDMSTKKEVLTMGLRETLKGIMQTEIENLPETLEALEPKERLNVVCKLMPYVFPKVNTVSSQAGEPLQLDNW